MAFASDPPRQVVPRWRPFLDSVSRGELTLIPVRPSAVYSEDLVAALVTDWKTKPSVSVAADLLSVAFTHGLDKVALDAAHYILQQKSSPRAARSLAALYLGNAGVSVDDNETQDLASPRRLSGRIRLLSPSDRGHILQINYLRNRLREFPRNAIEWCDLALHYTALGLRDKAQRAIEVALQLAPNNRFVLRAASRFFLHIGERDKSYRLLVRSPLLRTDPWIISAEIAMADAFHKSSSNIANARRMLEAKRFQDHHASELASALGTIDFKAGKGKVAKQNIQLSLRSPTENAVAQAVWVSRNIDSRVYVPEGVKSAEASAWTATEAGDWGTSLTQSLEWQCDQPFSSRPAVHGSFLAATIFEDFVKGMDIAEVGLRCNPSDCQLVNNYTFSAIMNGELDVAEKMLHEIDVESLPASGRFALVATTGLYAFRKGLYDEARRLYKASIHLARTAADKEGEALAAAYYAMEEMRISSQFAERACKEASDLADRLASPVGAVVSQMLDKHRAATSGPIRPPT